MCIWKHVCAATAKVLGALQKFYFAVVAVLYDRWLSIGDKGLSPPPSRAHGLCLATVTLKGKCQVDCHL